MRGTLDRSWLHAHAAALVAVVAVLFGHASCTAHAGPAEDFIREIPGKIERRARAFDVDARVRFRTPSCLPMGGGRACIVPLVQGIVFTVMEKDGVVIAAQVTMNRNNVRDQKDIGRAINALFLGAYDTEDRRQHDALALTGAMCILSGASSKVGRAEFEATPGGCVITVDR